MRIINQTQERFLIYHYDVLDYLTNFTKSISVIYASTGDGGGCCFKGASGESAKNANDNYHRSCICPTATNISDCENLCSKDKGCKGYTQHSNSLSCVLATTSLCPPTCHGPYKKDNLGLLDPEPSNCAQGEFNGGCFIKENGRYEDL